MSKPNVINLHSEQDPKFPNPASEFVFYRTYARWLEDKMRRETYTEAVDRLLGFYKKHLGDRVPQKVYRKIRERMLEFSVMPSMRALWTAGPAAEADNTAMYNCSFLSVDTPEAFSEGLYVLMCGTGLGFSVKKEDVEKLPVVPKMLPMTAKTFVIPDSKGGWADSVKELVLALYQGLDVEMDYTQIRPKGSRIKTFGGRASGPEPLLTLHNFIRQVFNQAQGRKLSTLECHDLMNQTAEVVVCGGVRRSAQISLSDLNDEEMRHAKTGNFPVRRYMANNSAIYEKKPTAVEFLKEWAALASSGSGERGIFNLEVARKNAPKRRDAEKIKGVNPCSEISLKNNEFCNLSEVVVRATDDLDDLLDKVETATWLGVIQSTFTHFPYLRPEWKQNCEDERLLGVSISGQMDNPDLLTSEAFSAAKKRALKVAKHSAQKLNVNMPASITCVKPSGCRPWNSLTTTSEGILTLEDLFGDHQDGDQWSQEIGSRKIMAIQNNAESQITKTFDNGKSLTKKIHLTYGMVLESTPNHKWFVAKKKFQGGVVPINEWVRADQVEKGMVIETVPGIYRKETHSKLKTVNSLSLKMRNDAHVISQPPEMDEDLAWMLGYLWGDGAMSPTKFRLRFTDQYVFNLEKVQRIVKEKFGLDSSIHKAPEHRNAMTLEIGSRMLWHWLIKNDVYKYFSDKIDIIPLCVRTSSWKDVVAFIAGLIDSDGWVGSRKGKNPTIGHAIISSADPFFSQHLQDVAWSVGVGIGRSLNQRGNNFQKKKAVYLMAIGKHTTIDAAQELLKHSNKMKRFNGDGWHFGPENQNVYTREKGEVLSIEDGPEVPTFDIEVNQNHWYYAGSVKSHNTVGLLVNSSPGLHPRYSRYYLRRYRISANDPLCKMIHNQGIKLSPENGQRPSDWSKAEAGDIQACSIYRPNEKWSEAKVTTWILEFPTESPPHAITRDKLSAIDQLEWYKRVQTNWCEHNASTTVYVKDDEWFEVGNWVYRNWETITGISFLPYDGGRYEQAPYEELTEEEFKKLTPPKIDYSKLYFYELEDQTEGAKALACSGGVCEI